MLARHAASPAHRTRPDPVRITAGSAALMIIALAALLLLQPHQWSELAVPARPNDPPTRVVLIPPTLMAPTPAPPAPATPVRRTPMAVTPPIPTPQRVDPQFLSPPTMPAPSTEFLAETAPSAPASSGTHEASIDYAFAPPPPYPAVALRAGIEGTVWLRIEVNAAGMPEKVTVERSSGNHALDSAARSHVLNRWRFQPARRAGEAMRGVALVPVAFRIEGR